MKELEYVEINVETKHETDLAVLFSDEDREFWVPKSQMEDWSEVGKSGIALVTEWFAEKENLI